MSDPNVERWRQRGRVCLWHYRDRPRSYPGWHLAANPEGNASLRELLELMAAARFPSEAVVAVTPPAEKVLSVPNYRRGEPQTAVRWRIKCVSDEARGDEWRIEYDGAEVRHTLGSAGLRELMEGLADMAAGRGDYALPSAGATPDDERLWIWWWPKD